MGCIQSKPAHGAPSFHVTPPAAAEGLTPDASESSFHPSASSPTASSSPSSSSEDLLGLREEAGDGVESRGDLRLGGRSSHIKRTFKLRVGVLEVSALGRRAGDPPPLPACPAPRASILSHFKYRGSAAAPLPAWLFPQGTTFINNYIVVDTLGRGTFGKVKLCLNAADDQLVAIKVISKKMVRGGLWLVVAVATVASGERRG